MNRTTSAVPIASHGLSSWWREGTPEARRALVAAGLGWMLDSFDVMLYALVVASIMPDLGLTKDVAGILGSVTLLASAAGGIIFGIIDARAHGERPHLLRVHRCVRARE
jgi:MFS family permease